MIEEQKHGEQSISARADQEKHILQKLSPICEVIMRQPGIEVLKSKIYALNLQPSEQMSKAERAEVNQVVEVEIKFRVDEDVEKLRQRLLANGFVLKTELDQQDCYSDHGHDLRDYGQDTRVRKEYKDGRFRKGEIKWEGPKGEIQDRPVVEVKVDNEAETDLAASLMDHHLGIKTFARLTKHRWHYIKQIEEGALEIELDTFDKDNPGELGNNTWIQIALEVPEERRGDSIELVKQASKELGLTNEDGRDYTEIAGIV